MDAQQKKIIIATAINSGRSLMDLILSGCEKVLELIDDEEHGDVVLAAFLGHVKETPPRLNMYVEHIVTNYNTMEFQSNFRMSRNAFEKFHQYVATNIHLIPEGENLKIQLEKQLLAVIWILATPESYRSIGERFDLAKSTLSVIFFRIINFLTNVAGKFIKFPNNTDKIAINSHFLAQTRLSGVIGAVDGTYVPCSVPADQKMAYTNRKMFTSVTLQAICDHKLSYTDCFIGFPSSVHDNRIFRCSIFYKNVQQDVKKYFNEGEKILGDKAYPVESWCIPPFIDRGNLSRAQKIFNKTHASCRQVIERSFALLYGRFRRLRYLDLKRTEYVPATILAACVLHNICIEYPDENQNAYEEEGLEHARNNNMEDNGSPGSASGSTRSGATIRNEMMRDLINQ